MTEDKEALLVYYRDTRQALLDAMDGLSDEQLIVRSLDGWSVKDHLAHLAFWDDLRADEVRRISAGHESALRTTGEQDDALNMLSHELRLRLSLQQVRWELKNSRERLLEEIAAATDRGLDGSLYGEAGLRSDHESEHTGWLRRHRESTLAGR